MKKMLAMTIATGALLLPLGHLATTSIASAAPTSTAVRADWYKAVARLRGQTLASGKGVYRDRERRAGVEQRLAIEIEDAEPNWVYEVHFNGTLLGEITTDEFGTGELNLKTARFIDDPEEWQPLPENFPRVIEGDSLTVGPVSGNFRVRS